MGLRWIEKMAYRRADLIVGTMPNLKQHVDESVGDRHAPVACIPFGYDPDMVEKARPLPEGVRHPLTRAELAQLKPYLTLAARKRAMARIGQTRSGLIEDALIVAAGVAIVALAVRPKNRW